MCIKCGRYSKPYDTTKMNMTHRNEIRIIMADEPATYLSNKQIDQNLALLFRCSGGWELRPHDHRNCVKCESAERFCDLSLVKEQLQTGTVGGWALGRNELKLKLRKRTTRLELAQSKIGRASCRERV